MAKQKKNTQTIQIRKSSHVQIGAITLAEPIQMPGRSGSFFPAEWKRSCQELVAQNQMAEAITALRKVVRHPGTERELILLMSDFTDIRARERMGLIDPASLDLGLKRVKNALLVVIEIMANQP